LPALVHSPPPQVPYTPASQQGLKLQHSHLDVHSPEAIPPCPLLVFLLSPTTFFGAPWLTKGAPSNSASPFPHSSQTNGTLDLLKPIVHDVSLTVFDSSTFYFHYHDLNGRFAPNLISQPLVQLFPLAALPPTTTRKGSLDHATLVPPPSLMALPFFAGYCPTAERLFTFPWMRVSPQDRLPPPSFGNPLYQAPYPPTEAHSTSSPPRPQNKYA